MEELLWISDTKKTNYQTLEKDEKTDVCVIGGRIYKRNDGEILAVKPYCGYLGCLISWNNLEKTWDCPCHGSRYDYMGNIITEPTVKV